MGIFLFVFFLKVAITGLLLGWKKNIDFLQEPTRQGASADVSQWLPMDTLIAIANHALKEQWGEDTPGKIDKLDVRPDKGIVKVIYAQHFHSFQIDAATGKILSVEYRTSDLIEQLHEGTWADRLFGFPGGIFKLFYTTILGLSLVTFSVTGFWLWYGPRVMRRMKNP